MKRAFVFAGRNIKELLRDPLSYIFCLGFPVVMLVIMTAINSIIPAGAMDIFNIDKLAPGIAVFALSFVMLFAALSVSKDRSGAFLARLFSSPMRAADFILGYMLPLLAVALGQFAVTYICAAVIGAADGVTLPLGGVLLSCLTLIPTALFFVSAGLLFGTLLSDKAAPPCSSIIISLCGIMGGIWFDLGAIPRGNALAVICRIFPFSHATDAARSAISGDLSDMWVHLAVTIAWAILSCAAAVLVFRMRMKSDKT
ncbi:MAG: ABC transporter permease [Clostridia bacterium]|nr:ABC transporter permease [Clostridia bacterium]